LVCLGLLAMWPAALASAAEPTLIPYKSALKDHRGDVKKMLRGGQISGDKDKMFEDFVSEWLVPQFVLPSNINDLHKVRIELQRWLAGAAPGPPRTKLIELTVNGFREILKKKAPAGPSGQITDDQRNLNTIKFNVILALGEMNETEKQELEPAKPLPQALRLLLSIAKPPAKKTSGLEDSLRQAALIGLLRHAESGTIPPDAQATLRAMMLAIVKQKEPPPGRLADANDYIRARAATVLAALKDPGPREQVAHALDEIINNPAESPGIRFDASSALGALAFPAGANVEFKAMADHVGHLAVDVCKQEVDHEQGATLEPRVQRRLSWWLRKALGALIGDSGRGGLLAATADPAQKKVVESVAQKLKTLQAKVDQNTDLASSLNELEGVLQPRGGTATAARSK
jgi:hypothetical protein